MDVNRIVCGDALEVLRDIPSGVFQTCVTSPPYWGLRDYGIEPQVWGGDAECEHVWGKYVRPGQGGGIASTKVQIKGKDNFQIVPDSEQAFCQRCGAWRGCLGLEPAPELYVKHLVEIFREVRRVLRDDGTVWLNLGSSYWGGKGRSGYELPHEAERRRAKGETFQTGHNVPGYMDMRPSDGRHNIFKPKDLVPIPWMVAMALQRDGWWLRAEAPWIKVNAMPESVKDRPTRGIEYWFLLSKSKKYYYDADAIREPFAGDTLPRYKRGMNENKWTDGAGNANSLNRSERWSLPAEKPHTMSQPRPNVRKLADTKTGGDGAGFRGHSGYYGEDGQLLVNPLGRNRRTSDWWVESLDGLIEETREYLAYLEEVRKGNQMLVAEDGEPLGLYYSTKSFKGAHFATFSPDMITPLVLCSTSKKGQCPKCGKAWVRVVEKQSRREGRPSVAGRHAQDWQDVGGASLWNKGTVSIEVQTLGWQPACDCDAGDPVPQLILDPFMGAGTTGLVAIQQGRNYFGIDASEQYCEMARQRIATTQPPLFVI